MRANEASTTNLIKISPIVAASELRGRAESDDVDGATIHWTSNGEERWTRHASLQLKASFPHWEWVEQCTSGPRRHQLRAVRRVPKSEVAESATVYRNEIHALMFFSDSEYEQYFQRYYGWYQDLECVYIAREYLEFGTLDVNLDPVLAEVDGRWIVSQIVQGVSFIHANGFAHTDLHPRNIVISEKRPNMDWRVKISDFGLSRRAETARTIAGLGKGVPGAFAAPEVLGRRDNDIPRSDYNPEEDQAADMWALGETCHQILTGEPVFDSPARRSTYYRRKKGRFSSRHMLNRRISCPGWEFVEDLLKLDPAQRLTAPKALNHPWFWARLGLPNDQLEDKEQPSYSSVLDCNWDDWVDKLVSWCDDQWPVFGDVRGARKCRHKWPQSHGCSMTTILCCICADKRPLGWTYHEYVDNVGEVVTTQRWRKYCPHCQESYRTEIEVVVTDGWEQGLSQRTTETEVSSGAFSSAPRVKKLSPHADFEDLSNIWNLMDENDAPAS